ncbi:FecR family protein [Sphingobium lignivorans]|uniref:Transmembrane sensor n=1 Tax=Sphingobium lignivorans TaxID=2735886 RepID=A0ABR6NI11_9SPHN|nr:FecR domain-containing protein [Sphingobium lignivorans]MBB5986923.1 transmembrane sensor [Sphingobium lignivorans]
MTWRQVLRKEGMEQPDDAASWLARARSGKMTESESLDLAGWLADDRNRREYEALNARLQGLEALRSHPDILAMREEARRPAWFRQPLAMAAASVLILGLSAGVLFLWNALPGSSRDAGVVTALYETPDGKTSTVMLPDGSQMLLDAATTVRASMQEDSRRIELLKGRANFVVAPDRQRPFAVKAGDRTVVALGTQFEVNLAEHSVEIVLMEGRVAVRDADKGRPHARDLVMKPGYRLVAGDGNWTLSPVDLRSLSRWKDGLLIFDEARIGDIVVEMNRYLPEKIVISSPAVADRRMSAVLRAGDVNTFLSAIDAIGIATWSHAADRTYRLSEADHKKI